MKTNVCGRCGRQSVASTFCHDVPGWKTCLLPCYWLFRVGRRAEQPLGSPRKIWGMAGSGEGKVPNSLQISLLAGRCAETNQPQTHCSASKSSAPVKRSLVRTKPRHWRGFVVYAFLAVPLAGFAADIGNESGGDEPEQLALGGPIDGQWHVLPEGIRGLDRRAFSQ